MQTRLFTPSIENGTYPGESMDDGRALMAITLEDNEKFYEAKRTGVPVVITDQNTDSQWLVGPAPCGLGCECAAVASPHEHDLNYAGVCNGCLAKVSA